MSVRAFAGKFKPFGATPDTPEYDLGKVTVPTAAFYADNDLLSDPAVSEGRPTEDQETSVGGWPELGYSAYLHSH